MKALKVEGSSPSERATRLRRSGPLPGISRAQKDSSSKSLLSISALGKKGCHSWRLQLDHHIDQIKELVLGSKPVGPPSDTHNNADLLVWALHLAGGDDRWVDVEELYLKAFELAPVRLSWRTRPDLPDYKKCAKALQELEDPKRSDHLGLTTKNGAYERRLTDQGLQWCETHEALLASLYSSTDVVPSASIQDDARRIRALAESTAYRTWTDTGELTCTLWELAEAFRCMANSPKATWLVRLDEHVVAARRNGNKELEGFIGAARHLVDQEVDA